MNSWASCAGTADPAFGVLLPVPHARHVAGILLMAIGAVILESDRMVKVCHELAGRQIAETTPAKRPTE